MRFLGYTLADPSIPALATNARERALTAARARSAAAGQPG